MYRVYFVLQLVQMNNKFYGENQDCPLDLNHKPDKTPFKTLIIFSKPIINNFICMILLYTPYLEFLLMLFLYMLCLEKNNLKASLRFCKLLTTSDMSEVIDCCALVQ